MFTSKKDYTTVLLEATFVGAILVIIVKAIDIFVGQYIKKVFKNYSYETTLFIAGFLFHVIFEYTGINEMYARNYLKLI